MAETTNRATRKVWFGSPITDCQVCDGPIKETFVDGRTKMGPWAILCYTCYRDHGVGLGIGKGQQYMKDGSEWVKVQG